jgi:hypothetical protein
VAHYTELFISSLLGHKSGRITTHYSAAEIGNLISAANKAYNSRQGSNGPTFTLLKQISSLPTAFNIDAELLAKSLDCARVGT